MRKSIVVPDVSAPHPTARPRRLAGEVTTGARRYHLTWLVPAAIMLTDQATKAVQPDGTFVVNTGGAAFIPRDIGDALWRNPILGAVSDSVGAVLLVTALLYARRLSGRLRAGTLMTLAGGLSNLADRLGTASLAHPALPRGSIDWIPVWPGAITNVADIFIATGSLIVGCTLMPFAVRSRRRAVRPGLRLRLAAASAALIAVAVWSGVWQANRQAVIQHEEHPATTCTAEAWTSAEDWLSWGCGTAQP